MKAYEASLVVGTRVRIKLSGECEYCDGDGGDGQVGVIVSTTLPTQEDGFDYAHETDSVILAHHYRVRYAGMQPSDWSGYVPAELLVIRDEESDAREEDDE